MDDDLEKRAPGTPGTQERVHKVDLEPGTADCR